MQKTSTNFNAKILALLTFLVGKRQLEWTVQAHANFRGTLTQFGVI